MKAILFRVIIMIFVTGSFLACDTKKVDAPNNVSYDSLSVSKIYHLENDSTKPSCSIKIKYLYPTKFENAEILTKIKRELNYAVFEDERYESLSPDSALEKYITDYIQNYQNEANVQFPDWSESDEAEDYFSFYKSIDTKVLYDKNNILSYQVSSMDFKGGATSSTIYQNIVIDLKTGNLVTEKDIFMPEYKKMLNILLTDKIVDQNKVKKAEDLLELGFWGIEDIASNDNFYIDNDGLTYIFNQGEYSAPSLGEIRVTFTFDELRSILNQNSPISFLFNK